MVVAEAQELKYKEIIENDVEKKKEMITELCRITRLLHLTTPIHSHCIAAYSHPVQIHYATLQSPLSPCLRDNSTIPKFVSAV